jgi:hypothetical protein
MSATSLDLSQIKTDALSAASTFRTLIGLGSGNTPTFLGASLTGGTVTASTPLINATQTWNNAATTFTGILANVVDTASSSSSLLMDLQVGGVSRFKIDKDGKSQVQSSNVAAFEAFFGGTRAAYFGHVFGNGRIVLQTNDPQILLGTNEDVALRRDAAQTLAQRNAGNAQTFRIYESFTDASNYTRGKLEWSSNVFRIGTEKAGTGSARALELQTDGTTRLTIGTTGNTTVSNGYLYFENSNGYIVRTDASNTMSFAPSNGTAVGNITAAGWIHEGGFFRSRSTSNFAHYITMTYNGGAPFLECSTPTAIALDLRCDTGAAIKNKAGTADANLTAAALTLSGNLTISTKNIVTDTTTGTKIGTATTQKLAFWNATPVVQPTAVADATDAASVITQLNALLSRMRTLGLIAT